jgi:hypothetical protein
MTDMTQEQARAEALRRWGPGSTITYRPSRASRLSRGRLARYSCTVSNGNPGRAEAVEGQGDTWREAFADARER